MIINGIHAIYPRFSSDKPKCEFASDKQDFHKEIYTIIQTSE